MSYPFSRRAHIIETFLIFLTYGHQDVDHAFSGCECTQRFAKDCAWLVEGLPPNDKGLGFHGPAWRTM